MKAHDLRFLLVPQPCTFLHRTAVEGGFPKLSRRLGSAAHSAVSKDFSFPSVDRLDRDQHPHLGCNLDHGYSPRQARSNTGQSGGVLVLQWMRSLRPRADSNSITYSSTLWRVAPISSMNLAGAFFRVPLP